MKQHPILHTDRDLEVIANALVVRPYGEVAATIASINRQLAEAAPAPKKPRRRSKPAE